MRVAQVSQSGGPFEIVERPIPEPGPGQIRVKVQACGVCHSDSLVKEGAFPGLEFPRVPGHEIAGVVDAVGPDVSGWSDGQSVGVGWNGGYCGRCVNCRHGDFFACSAFTAVTGITYDGGFGEYMIARAEAVAALPSGMASTDAAPLMCAGVTTFNALRNSGARPGDIVAVLGLGGLGHLGVQYASRMGFRTVAIARGPEKAELAHELGAWRYVDSLVQDPAQELQELGGAKVILATVTHGEAMTATMGGLGANGTLLVLGAAHALEVPPLLLITGKRSVKGWYSGISIDSQETAAFSVQAGVQSKNEVYPFEQVNEAYERMMSGKARFRVVLDLQA